MNGSITFCKILSFLMPLLCSRSEFFQHSRSRSDTLVVRNKPLDSGHGAVEARREQASLRNFELSGDKVNPGPMHDDRANALCLAACMAAQRG